MTLIDSFIARFKGGARANLFQVVLSGGSFEATDNFTFMCKASSIPGRTIGEVQVPYLNRKIPYAGDPDLADWEITVINDTDFAPRDSFEKWQQAIQDRAVVTGTTNISAIFGKAEVIQLDRDRTVLRTYNLYNVWPSVVGPITLAYENNNQIEEFTVTFKYSHFEPVTS